MAISINGSTGISGVNGSAATPAIQGGDSDTGIFFGTDTASVATAGNERLIVDANGNINIDSGGVFYDATNNRLAIGTTVPNYILDCQSSGATNVARFLTGSTSSSEVAQFGRSDQAVNLSIDYDGAGAMGIGTTTAHPFLLKTGATEKARLDTSGRLLVGTSSSSTAGDAVVRIEKPASGTAGAGVQLAGTYSIDDDVTESFGVGNASLVFISENNTGDGALFFCSYKSSTVTLISDPNNRYAVSDTDGRVCVFKSANSGSVSLKNRLGFTKSFTIGKIITSD